MINILNVVTVLHNLMATDIEFHRFAAAAAAAKKAFLYRLLNVFLALQAQVDCQNEASEKAFFYNQVTKIAGCQTM